MYGTLKIQTRPSYQYGLLQLQRLMISNYPKDTCMMSSSEPVRIICILYSTASGATAIYGSPFVC